MSKKRRKKVVAKTQDIAKKQKESIPTKLIPNWLQDNFIPVIIIFLLACLVYSNTITHDFAQDDAIVLYDNDFTKQGINGIDDIFKYDTFRGFFKVAGKDKLVEGGRYRPFTLAMMALEVEVFGVNATIGHIVNVLLFGLTAVLFYWTILLLFQARPLLQASPYWVAFIAAILFAVHPIHTEAVANIKGRDEIMALLGSLAALYFYFKSCQQQNFGLSLLAGLVFFVGLLSKENAITYIPLIALAVFYFSHFKISTAIKNSLPIVIAAIVFLMIRSSVLGMDFGASTMEMMNNPYVKVVDNEYIEFSSSEKSATVTYTLGKYIQLLFFPHPLTHDYYPRHIDIMSWSDWRVILSLLVYIALIGVSIINTFKRKPISFAIWAYLIPLFLVSNIIFPIGTNMAERLLFMPSIGFCLAVAILIDKWLIQNQRFKLFLPLGIVGLITLLLSVKTITRNQAWKDDFTLFTTDIKTSPNSAKLRNAVGGALTTRASDMPDGVARQQMLSEAATHLKKAVLIHPSYKNAYLQLGNVHNYLRRYDEAIQYYNAALSLDSNYPDALNNLAITYREAGRYYGEQQGDLTKAITYLQRAYEMSPTAYEVVRLLGVAYGMSGNGDLAIQFFTKAVELQPNNADAIFNLGSAYYNAGNPEKGQQYHQQARAIDPNAGQAK